jgi:hypothetical protein
MEVTRRSGTAYYAVLLSVVLTSSCSWNGTGGSQNAVPSGAGAAYQSSYVYDPDPSDIAGLGSRSGLMDPLGARLRANQTVGFGLDKRLIFTYQQQFDCVVMAFDDRNFSGKPAARDPQQFASPECQIDPSKMDPTGIPAAKTDPLYVLLPFFETDKRKGAFSKALGKELKKLFGFVPDAFKPDPGVPVQCPAPKDKPATCTMHPLETDIGPMLTKLGLLPKDTNMYVPLANHDHILDDDDIVKKPEWWRVVIVLVKDPKVWPNAAGTSGITSAAKLDEAEKKGQASHEYPSNFFLFFSSKIGSSADSIPGMHM